MYMKNNTILSIGVGVVALVFTPAGLITAETTGAGVQSKPQPLLYMEAGGEAGGEGGIIMEDRVKMEGTTMTKEEMENARPMEKNIDAIKNEIDTDDDTDEDLFDIEIDIDVDALMNDKNESSHTHEGKSDIDEADDVDSAADFEHFVSFKVKADDRIKDVDIKDGNLVVTYALPVKFFGFWKTSLNTTAEVDSAGTVEVRYPWYAIFMRKEFSKKTLEPIFTASLEAEQGGSAKAYVVPHVFDTVVKTFSEVSSSELSYSAKTGKTGKTK